MNIPFFGNKKDMEEADIAPYTGKNHYYLPDFYRNAALFLMLSDFVEHIPQWFYEDIDLAAAYGSFPNCIWNGGRTLVGDINRKRMVQTVEEFNKRGIAVRYTFTNPLIEEKHLNDTFANMCLEIADNGKNEVLVNSPILEQYVRENYPNFKIISSTTKCLKTVAEVEAEFEKDYYLVVLDSTLNNTPEIFNMKHRDKIEVLIDHGCRVNCPNREKHYIACGTAQLRFDTSEFPRCTAVERSFEELKSNGSFITREMILGQYNQAGFRHFKLDGRSFEPDKLVESLLYYFVKPEFRDKFKGIIQKEIYDRFKEM